MAQLMSTPSKTLVARAVERTFNRVSAVESGRQPGYGKREQLIEDGINDQWRHIELAKTLDHPFNTLEALKPIHANVVEGLSQTGELDIRRRLAALEKWKGIASSPEVCKAQAADELSAGIGAVRLGRRPRTALMKLLSSIYETMQPFPTSA